jgi:hypothetical protein
MAAIQIQGFLPDADPTTPGVWTACDGWIPTSKGMRAAYEPITVGYDALAAACKGAVIARLVSGTTRLIAGTTTKLYDIQSGAWTSVTRQTLGADVNYSSGSERWRFAQVGNVTLAVNHEDLPQYSITSGRFANLAGMPKARYIDTSSATAGAFVVLGGTDDSGLGITGGANAEDDNRVWWSGIGNYTTWAPSLATQAGMLQLVDTPGPITGLRQLGDYMAVYKARATYLLTYGGATVLWGARNVSSEIGALSNECVISTGLAHYFLGQDSVYRFSGDQPVDIGSGIRNWLSDDLDYSKAASILGTYDKRRDLLIWYYPSVTGGGAIDHWIALHIASGRWGAGTTTVECVLEAVGESITYDNFGGGMDYDELPDVVFDSDYWSAGRAFTAVFNSSHVLCSLTNASGSNSFTTGYVGSDIAYSHVRRLTPRWLQVPTSATCEHSHTSVMGTATTSNALSAMVEGRFDLRQSSRWHRFTVYTEGNAELSWLDIDGIAAGKE